MKKKRKDTVAVVGAGISGLSAAWALRKKGVPVTVYEQSRVAGGVMQTFREKDWLIEEGPNTVMVRDQIVWDFFDDLNLTTQVQTPDSNAKKRFIVRDGAPVAVPQSFTDFFTTRLLSASAKLRLLKEPFVSTSPNDDESVARFVQRRLGPEVLDYLVNPFLSGIYAGDPQSLSMKHTFESLFNMERTFGSIAKGMLKREKPPQKAKRALISFREGLQHLPKTIAHQLGDALQFNSRVTRISPAPYGWDIKLKRGDETVERSHRRLISTLPAHQLPAVWGRPDEHITALANIRYAPMSVLSLGFHREQVQHPLDGFGMLIPKKEPFSMLGCLFPSSLFSHRAPENHVLLSCFMGGVRHSKRAALPMESLITEVLPQLRTLLGVEGLPVFSHHRYWPQAIPQYTVGYNHYLQQIARLEESYPPLSLLGNYRDGVSVPDCIKNGLETAKKVEPDL